MKMKNLIGELIETAHADDFDPVVLCQYPAKSESLIFKPVILGQNDLPHICLYARIECKPVVWRSPKWDRHK